MDDTIYLKTTLGQETIQTRNAVLSRSERSILIMVDGKKTGAELVRMGAAMGMTTDAAALTVARLQSLGMAVSASSTLTGIPAAQPMKLVVGTPVAAGASMASPKPMPSTLPVAVAALAAATAPIAPALPAAAPSLANPTNPTNATNATKATNATNAQTSADTVAMKAMSTTAAIRIVTAAIQASAFVEPEAATTGTTGRQRATASRKDEFLDSLADQVDSADSFAKEGQPGDQLHSQFGRGALSKADAKAPEGPITNGPSFANFAEQFDVILGALAAEIHSQLGLRGMDLSVKADNAQSVEDLKDIADELYQVITRAKGAAAANNTQSRLDALFVVPVAH